MSAEGAAAYREQLGRYQSSCSQFQLAWINGWPIYQGGSGSGVDVVHVYGCPTLSCGTPTFWGAATYGLASPGVAAFYGSAFGNAGYSFVMSGLAPAQYTIQIYAHNTVTNGWTVFERTTTVTATPLHTIETPTTNQGVAQPFALTGWAIDGSNPTGTGVDAVDVSGYPEPAPPEPETTLEKAACVADTFINAALSSYVPGYVYFAAMTGVRFNLVSGLLPCGEFPIEFGYEPFNRGEGVAHYQGGGVSSKFANSTRGRKSDDGPREGFVDLRTNSASTRLKAAQGNWSVSSCRIANNLWACRK